jgi:hypothetical protein
LDPFATDLPIDFHPFTGWALTRAATLDLGGTRGLIADIATASILKRQAAFFVLATTNLDTPKQFLGRLGSGLSRVGDAIRIHSARDLVSAAHNGVPVPSGVIRALMRIGYQPLAEPSSYSRLFEIFANPMEARKAHALRYCGTINAATIQIVDALDPNLIDPEIVKGVRSIEHAHHVNDIVRLLKQTCSAATDTVMVNAVRQAVANGDIQRFARRWVRRADRFPPPPLSLCTGVKPLTTAAEMIEEGKAMSNCFGTKIGDVLLGLSYFYVADIPVTDTADMPVAVELNPLSNGKWFIASLHGPANRALPPYVVRIAVDRFLQIGAVLPTNPDLHPKAKELAEVLGVFRYGEFDFYGQEDATEQEDVAAALRGLEDFVHEWERLEGLG